MEDLKKELDLAASMNFKERVEQLGPVFRAVFHCDLTALEELLRCGINPDEIDSTPSGFTAAHWAAITTNSNVLELLEQYHANLSAVDKTGMTPLHVAATVGNCNTLLWLLENTHDMESKDGDRQTPLHLASINGHIEVVRMLLNHGASVDPVDSFGMTPICMAMVGGKIDVVVFLLDHGANPGVRDANNKSLLHAAASNDDTKAIAIILEKGIDVNAIDNANCTPLHDAAKNGSSQAVYTLMCNGADVGAKDCQGHTPLYMATEAGHMECVSLLTQSMDAAPEEMKNLTPIKYCFKMELDSCNNKIDAADGNGNIHLVDNGAEMDDKHCRGPSTSLMAKEDNNTLGETVELEYGLTDPTSKEGGVHRMEGNCAVAEDLEKASLVLNQDTEEEIFHEENSLDEPNKGSNLSSKNDG